MPTPLGVILLAVVLLAVGFFTALKFLFTIGGILIIVGICWLIWTIIVQGGKTPRV